MSLGGRVAEEIIFGPEAVTTGASNDIERATSIARNMVTKWGLSDRLGPLSYSEEEGEVFLGRSVTRMCQMTRHMRLMRRFVRSSTAITSVPTIS